MAVRLIGCLRWIQIVRCRVSRSSRPLRKREESRLSTPARHTCSPPRRWERGAEHRRGGWGGKKLGEGCWRGWDGGSIPSNQTPSYVRLTPGQPCISSLSLSLLPFPLPHPLPRGSIRDRTRPRTRAPSRFLRAPCKIRARDQGTPIGSAEDTRVAGISLLLFSSAGKRLGGRPVVKGRPLMKSSAM